jgi:hypothetical protein
MASSPQTEKEILFARLDHLDELALEDEEAEEDKVTVDYTSKHKYIHTSATKIRESHTGQSNDPGSKVGSLTSPARTTELALPTPSSQETMRAQNPSPKSGSNKIRPKPSKKQRARKSLQLQPEDAQVFRGLTLCKV